MIGRKKKSCLALLMEPSRLFFTTANQFFDTVYFTDPSYMIEPFQIFTQEREKYLTLNFLQSESIGEFSDCLLPIAYCLLLPLTAYFLSHVNVYYTSPPQSPTPSPEKFPLLPAKTFPAYCI